MSKNWKIFLLVIVWVIFFAGSWNFVSMVTDFIIKRPGGARHLSDLEPATAAFSVTNPQGTKIEAWWYQGKHGAGAILLCHGHGVRHEEMRDVFEFLRKAGYSLLMLDFRAHGKSGGDYTSVGLHEWEDVDVVLKEAEKRGYLPPDVTLAAYGRSMGAATLANGAVHLPRIQVFILESMYSELRKVAANDAAHLLSLPDCFLIDLIFWNAFQRTGIQFFDSKPFEAVKNIYPRPLLLIHDARDARVLNPDFERVAKNASGAKTLVFSEAEHVRGHQTEPDDK